MPDKLMPQPCENCGKPSDTLTASPLVSQYYGKKWLCDDCLILLEEEISEGIKTGTYKHL